MAMIFHQNMRTYGGNSVPRNAFFSIRLAQINMITGPQYIIAGFTEIMNAGNGLRAHLLAVAQHLDAGFNHFVVVDVGKTSVGARTEYIAIATDTGAFAVAYAGGVIRNSWGDREWIVYRRTNANIPLDRTIPVAGHILQQTDNRGVAFVAGQRLGTYYIIGFMHNMYAVGERTLAYRDLGKIASLIRADLGGNYAAAEVIFGGDFNVSPDVFVGRRNPTRAGVATRSVFGEDVWGNPVNTTAVNAYDFWVVTNNAIVNASAEVWNQTFVMPVGSDHKAVTLSNV